MRLALKRLPRLPSSVADNLGVFLLLVLVPIAAVPFFVDGGLARWLVLLVFAGGFALTSTWAKRVTIDAADIGALLFTAYAATSLIWTPDLLWGVVCLAKLGVLVVLFLVLRRRRLDEVVPLAIAFAVLAVLVLHWVGWVKWSGFVNPNLVAEFILVATPFLLLKRCYLSIAGAAWLYLFLINPSNLEYLILGLGFVGWVCWKDRGPVNILLFVLAGLVLLVGFVISLGIYEVRISVLSRIELLYNTLTMWSQAPILGHGVGSFDYVYPVYGDAILTLFPEMVWSVLGASKLYAGSAHNEFAQLLSELGIVGALLVVLFLMAVTWKPDTRFKRGCIGSLIVLGILSLIGFPLQMPSTALFGVVALAGLCGKSAASVVWTRRRRWPSVAVVPLLVAGMWYWGAQAAIGQMLFAESVVMIPRDALHALVRNRDALDRFRPDQMARLQIFKTAVLANEKVTIAPETIHGAYEISLSASPNHAGTLLARFHWLIRETGCGDESDATEGQDEPLYEGECFDILNRLSRQSSRVQEVAEVLREVGP